MQIILPLPNIGKQPVFGFLREFLVAWQILLQELVLFGSAQDQYSEHKHHWEKSPPGTQQERCAEIGQQCTAVARMAHLGVGSAVDDMVAAFGLQPHHP